VTVAGVTVGVSASGVGIAVGVGEEEGGVMGIALMRMCDGADATGAGTVGGAIKVTCACSRKGSSSIIIVCGS
jgi:hypothetical protein